VADETKAIVTEDFCTCLPGGFYPVDFRKGEEVEGEEAEYLLKIEKAKPVRAAKKPAKTAAKK